MNEIIETKDELIERLLAKAEIDIRCCAGTCGGGHIEESAD